MTIASGQIGRLVHFIISEKRLFVVLTKGTETSSWARLVSLLREEEKRCCFKQLTVHQLKERKTKKKTSSADLWLIYGNRLYYKLYYLYIGHIIPTQEIASYTLFGVPILPEFFTCSILERVSICGIYYILLQLRTGYPRSFRSPSSLVQPFRFPMIAQLWRSSFFRANLTFFLFCFVKRRCDNKATAIGRIEFARPGETNK